MSSTYSNLGIELIGTGEQAGTWGLTTNSNFSAIIDNAIVGAVTIAVTGTAVGAPTILQVTDGAASDGQKRILTASGALGSAGYLQIAPNDFAGYYFIRNSTGQSLNIFQGTWNGSDANRAVTIENGFEAIIRCNGGGVGAVVTFINYKLKTGPLLVTNESTVGTVITGTSSDNALRITQIGSGNALLVEDDTNPDSTPFVIDASGAVGMGITTVAAGTNFYNVKNITGNTTANANATNATIQSDVTSSGRGYATILGTAAAAFTLANLRHFYTNQATFGAGSTVNNQSGYYSEVNLTGATNNYGFYAGNTGGTALGVSAKTSYAFYSASDIATATYGTAYAFYAAGTAPNVFTGTVSIGGTAAPTKFNVRVDSSGAVSDVMLLQNNTSSVVNTGVALYFDPNGNGVIRAASIQSVQSTAGNHADLRFFTAAGATPAERMRIDTLGNVGIGTTSTSSYRLNVSSTGTIVWGVSTDATTAYLYSSGIVNVGSTGANSVALVTNNLARVTVDSAGNVTSTGPINKVTITAPATGSTLTIADGKTATVSNTLTLAGTDGTTMTFPPTSSNVGYLEIPQNAQTGSYTLVLTDSGKHIYHAAAAAAATYTIPANASVAFPIGAAITFINLSVNNVTIAITTDTMYLAGAGTTGSRTLAQYGSATAIKITSTSWIINGMGLT